MNYSILTIENGALIYKYSEKAIPTQDDFMTLTGLHRTDDFKKAFEQWQSTVRTHQTKKEEKADFFGSLSKYHGDGFIKRLEEQGIPIDSDLVEIIDVPFNESPNCIGFKKYATLKSEEENENELWKEVIDIHDINDKKSYSYVTINALKQKFTIKRKI